MDINDTILIGFLTAGSALFGAISGELLKTLRIGIEHKKQQSDLLREKYEELAERLSDSHEWIEAVIFADNNEKLKEIGSARHTRRIETLANLYFIEIRDAATKFKRELFNVYKLLLNNKNRDTLSPELESAFEAAWQAQKELENAVIEYSSKYT
jgi:hypothetical protein